MVCTRAPPNRTAQGSKLYKLPPDARYTAFAIPKSSGGTRQILAPIPPLKLAQRRLALRLQDCLQTIESEQIIKPDCIISHGFKRDLSIATNAQMHLNRRWVFNIDLVDFFPSVNFGRVRGFFIKNKHFQMQPQAATVLAQLACYQNLLPQGAPTSPVISNLIAGLLDIRLNKLASRSRCTFTRYADDITFSTNLSEFPSALARKNTGGLWEPSSLLLRRIRSCGFNVNAKKDPYAVPAFPTGCHWVDR
jgi:RNA-directed DNA polymerase